jgi:hypothetical protein
MLEVCEWTVFDWKLSSIIKVEGVTTIRNRIEFGRLVEWSIALALKAREPKCFVGSNPTSSAIYEGALPTSLMAAK